MVIYPNKLIMEVNIAVLTVTDTRTFENDKSGGILVKKIAEQKHRLVDRKIVKDENIEDTDEYLNINETTNHVKINKKLN